MMYTSLLNLILVLTSVSNKSVRTIQIFTRSSFGILLPSFVNWHKEQDAEYCPLL